MLKVLLICLQNTKWHWFKDEELAMADRNVSRVKLVHKTLKCGELRENLKKQ
jgi:hypothetical protein